MSDDMQVEFIGSGVVGCPVCGCEEGIVYGMPGVISCPRCKTGCYAPLSREVQANIDEADRIWDQLTDVGAMIAALRTRLAAAEARVTALEGALTDAAGAMHLAALAVHNDLAPSGIVANLVAAEKRAREALGKGR